MAPARAAPCDSSARRSRRPLPATRSMEFAPLRCLDVVMFRSPRRHSYRVPTGPDHDVGNAAPLWLWCLERRRRITIPEPDRCWLVLLGGALILATLATGIPLHYLAYLPYRPY